MAVAALAPPLPFYENPLENYTGSRGSGKRITYPFLPFIQPGLEQDTGCFGIIVSRDMLFAF